MKAGVAGVSLTAAVLGSALVIWNPVAWAQISPEPPVVTIVATDHHAAEAETDPGIFTVSRTGNTEASLLVFYELSGTARNGLDYVELSRTLEIPAGAATATITIKPIDDALAEGTETVVATLVPSPTLPPFEPYRVGFPNSDVVLLADNDSPVTNQPPCVPVPDGIVNWWPANGNPAEAINHRDGVLLNGATFGDGKVGRGFLLDGEDDCVRIPFVAGRSNYSVEAWVKPLSQVADREGQELIFGQAFGGPQLAVRAGASGMTVRWQYAVDPVNFAAAVSTHEIPIGEFSHLAGTWDGSTLRLYIDGLLAAENTPTNPPATSTCDFFIGGFFNGCDYTGQFFHGVIDEVSLYGRALSAETVARLFQAGDAGKCPPYEPPVVTLLNPTNRAIFTAPANINLVAIAPYFSRVEQVEFFSGNLSLGLGTFVPTKCAVCPNWVLDWTNVPPGEYTLTAQATDLFGRGRNSDPVHIAVTGIAHEPVVLIPAGSVWKYLDDGSDQGQAWREPGFDDGAWKSGPAQLGFGEGDEATVLTPGVNDRRFITYYFRRAFEVADAESISNLTVHLLRDDGAVVYLNGVEALRSNLPDGAIAFDTLAVSAVGPDTENQFHLSRINPRLLVNGRNVVAVEVHQASVLSSDVSFDLALTANGNIPPENLPPVVHIFSPTNGQSFGAPAEIIIRAEAGDRDGFVRRVDFYAGERLIGTDETSPYSFDWLGVPPGQYVLRARATDDQGASAVSEPVKIIVTGPPLLPIVNIEATGPVGLDPCPGCGAGPEPAFFTVRRTSGTNMPLTVFYTVSGTAMNGVDYEKLPGQLTIPEGAWSAQIVVNVIDDNLVEETETVVVTLVQPDCIQLDPPPPGCYRVGEHNRAVAYIHDLDALSNVPPFVRIARPISGSMFTTLTNIILVAEALDPDGWVGLIEFFANERKIGEQVINFVVAPPPGQLQTIDFNWKSAPAGQYVLTAKATDNRGATGVSPPIYIKVSEDEIAFPPVVTIHARDPFAREGTNALGEVNAATFVVRRSHGTNTELAVAYSIHGTAENGVDYEKLSGSVTIPAGRFTARIVVTPIADELREGIETVILKLAPAPETMPAFTPGVPDEAAAIIVDPDSPRPVSRRLPDGLFHLCVPHVDGVGVRLEASTDLSTWQPLETGIVTEGALQFVDPDAREHSQRFYRVVAEVNIPADD